MAAKNHRLGTTLQEEIPHSPSPTSLPLNPLELPSIESLHLNDSHPSRPRIPLPPSSLSPFSPFPLSLPLSSSPVPLLQSRLSLPLSYSTPVAASTPPLSTPASKMKGSADGESKNLREGRRKLRRKEQLNDLLRTAKITKQDTLVTFHSSVSPFSTLIHNREARRRWKGFNAAPDEEQEAFLENTGAKQRGLQRLSSASPSDCFRRINQSLRKTLKRTNAHLEHIDMIEDQILVFLNKEDEYDLCDFEAEDFPMEEDDFDFCGLEAQKPKNVKLTLHLDDGFLRLLAHGISQYYDLNSTSIDCDGERITVITKKSSNLTEFPTCRLSEYLRAQRSVSA